MIIPSIDLMGGQAVQLIGGEKKAIEAGDPMPIADRFSVAGPLAVIDLDAALGQGDNSDLIRAILRRHPCRVGGGIRDEHTAISWLDAGAEQVILGTAATPDLLSKLPRQRIIAALDARDGEVVVEAALTVKRIQNNVRRALWMWMKKQADHSPDGQAAQNAGHENES